jgi:hypothetical protein
VSVEKPQSCVPQDLHYAEHEQGPLLRASPLSSFTLCHISEARPTVLRTCHITSLSFTSTHLCGCVSLSSEEHERSSTCVYLGCTKVFASQFSSRSHPFAAVRGQDQITNHVITWMGIHYPKNSSLYTHRERSRRVKQQITCSIHLNNALVDIKFLGTDLQNLLLISWRYLSISRAWACSRPHPIHDSTSTKTGFQNRSHQIAGSWTSITDMYHLTQITFTGYCSSNCNERKCLSVSVIPRQSSIYKYILQLATVNHLLQYLHTMYYTRSNRLHC